MHRTIRGIPFRIPSPSVYLFVDHAAQLAYNGAAWVLSMRDPNGGPFQYREFASRDAAIDRVVDSIANVG